MIPITKQITLTFAGQSYPGHIYLTYYPSTKRPALVFNSPIGEPIAKLSINPDFTPANVCLVAIKTWTENEGLLPQLLALRDEDDEPLFIDVNLALPAGYEFAPLLGLSKPLQKVFKKLLKDERNGS